MVTFFVGEEGPTFLPNQPTTSPRHRPEPIEAHLMQLSSLLTSLHFEAMDVALQLQNVPGADGSCRQRGLTK